MKTEYDIIIVGAGPAGLSAAIAAAESGKSILILDNNPQAGGQIWRAGPIFPIPKLAQDKYRKIQSATNIDVIYNAKIVAAPFAGQLFIELLGGCLNLVYEQLILCTGARELFLPFPGWTLMGVTGAGGLQALIKAGTAVTNERIVIAGTGPLLLASADTAKKAGANVITIAEQAMTTSIHQFALKLWRWPAKIIQALSLPYRLYQPNTYIVEALGRDRLEAVKLKTPDGLLEIECDRLACGFGLVPNIQVGQLLGCSIQHSAIDVDEYQQTSEQNVFAAGECTGFGGSELSIIEGYIAGYMATGQLNKASHFFGQRQRYQLFAHLLAHTFKLRPEVKRLAQPSTIFCRCEDVTFDRVVNCHHWIEAKLQTRCGMGACQGSTCATAAAYLFDWQLPNSKLPLFPTQAKNLVAMSSTALNQK